MKSSNRQLRFHRELSRLTTQEVLIQSLNGDPSLSGKARERLAKLIELIQQADNCDKKSLIAQRDNLLEEINKKLLRYRWSPLLEKLSKVPGLNLSYEYRVDSLEERHENWCVFWISELVRQKDIWRLRRCVQCGRWLWAIREHKKHCSENCRKKHASHDPGFKKKRRLYMRDFRRKERERDERAKKSVRRNKR